MTGPGGSVPGPGVTVALSLGATEGDGVGSA